MKEEQIEEEISLFYVQAEQFPAGIGAAFQKLHALLPSVEGRDFFGISFPGPGGEIIYRAAVKALHEGEGEALGCPVFTVPTGTYLSHTLINWHKDETSIGKTFRQFLADPRLDPDGFCLEVYLNEKDVQCMVKILP